MRKKLHYEIYQPCLQCVKYVLPIVNHFNTPQSIHDTFLHQCSIQNQNYNAKSLFMTITIHGNECYVYDSNIYVDIQIYGLALKANSSFDYERYMRNSL